LQLHELRFAEGSPIGGTKEKENCSFWTLQCLVGLFVAKLIRQGECRRFLADLKPNWPSNSLAGLAAFLPASGGKKSNGNQNGNPNFHLCSRFDAIPLIHSTCGIEQ
jgi:hypothetical protein